MKTNNETREYIKYEKGKLVYITPDSDNGEMKASKSRKLDFDRVKMRGTKIKDIYIKNFNLQRALSKFFVVFSIFGIISCYFYYSGEKDIMINNKVGKVPLISEIDSNTSNSINILNSNQLNDRKIMNISDINNEIDTFYEDEIPRIEYYLEGKSTYISLNSKLQSNLRKKQRLLELLYEDKEGFKENDKYLGDILNSTEQRLLNSIDFSNTILRNIERNRVDESMKLKIETFKNKDIDMRKSSVLEVI